MVVMAAAESEWAERVKAWRASGRSARVFCEDKTYSVHSLRYWSQRLREQAVGGVRLARVEPIRPAESQPASGLASVAAAEPSAPTSSPRALAAEPIVVEVGAAKVVVGRGFDAATLRAVITALGGGR